MERNIELFFCLFLFSYTILKIEIHYFNEHPILNIDTNVPNEFLMWVCNNNN